MTISSLSLEEKFNQWVSLTNQVEWFAQKQTYTDACLAIKAKYPKPTV